MEYAIAIIVGYFLGSIPFGLLLGKIVKGVDVRNYGSGKIGTANVTRTAGYSTGLAVLVLDMGKSVLAVMIPYMLDGSIGSQVAAGLAALIGHNWSIFIGLQGGRGTAPGLGALLFIAPLAAPGIIVGILVIFLSRYISLGSITGAAGAGITAIGLTVFGVYELEHLLYVLIAAFIIILKHNDNVRRILNGQERKIGQKAMTRNNGT